MARENLIKAKSLYSLAKKTTDTNVGTIYEQDYMTIRSNDDIFNGEMVLFSDSNFKFRVRAEKNTKKKHVRQPWIKPSEDNDTTEWTLENMPEAPITEETKIVLKPNYTSLRDFAYYGSSIELIRATVNDILMRFPGAIYAPNSGATKIEVKYPTESAGTYYLLSNDFDIDCWTKTSVGNKNSLRTLADSFECYEFNKSIKNTKVSAPRTIGPLTGCPNSIIGRTNLGVFTSAPGESAKWPYLYLNNDGNIMLAVKTGTTTYIDNNFSRPLLVPKQEYIDAFWDSLDDFEKVLLNRDTAPKYKATFETVHFDKESGYTYENKDYIWPTVNPSAYSLDVSSIDYQSYIGSLVNLAEYYDLYESDNIWRMLTHEAIKNLDWTFVNQQDGEPVDASDIDSSRIKAMLRVYGRQFDEIKRYIDNIKNSISVSYDEKNNVPDYFLTDKVENGGWDAYSVSPTQDIIMSGETGAESAITIETDVIYTGSSSVGYTPTDSNVNFMRRLTLNSNYIQSLKGTRRGLETIFGMFGYHEAEGEDSGAGTYSITEQIAIAQNFPIYDKIGALRILGNGEYVYEGENTNSMIGYPVRMVHPTEDETHSGATYIIPWYDANDELRDPFYFQANGGWGKMQEKLINLPFTSASTIRGDGNLSIYEETEPYMRFAPNIEAMLEIPSTELERETVCYVTDISNIVNGEYADNPICGDISCKPMYKCENCGAFYSADTPTHICSACSGSLSTDYSHYFILKNKILSQHVGYLKNDVYECYGWKNVYLHELGVYSEPDDTGNTVVLTSDGLRVLYLESIVAENRGNNPHIGRGLYDDGAEYIDRFNHLFKEAVKDGIYDHLKNDEDKEKYCAIVSSGFCVNFMSPNGSTIDNKKCHYFVDTLEVESSPISASTNDSTEDIYVILSNDTFYTGLTIPSEERCINANKKYDECAANSVINVKNININFNTDGNIYLKDYFQNVVLRYLEPMIPSTAILSYTFDNGKTINIQPFDRLGPDVNIYSLVGHAEVGALGTSQFTNTSYYIDSDYYRTYVEPFENNNENNEENNG